MKTILSVLFSVLSVCAYSRDTNRYDRVETREGFTFSQRGCLGPSNEVVTSVFLPDVASNLAEGASFVPFSNAVAKVTPPIEERQESDPHVSSWARKSGGSDAPFPVPDNIPLSSVTNSSGERVSAEDVGALGSNSVYRLIDGVKDRISDPRGLQEIHADGDVYVAVGGSVVWSYVPDGSTNVYEFVSNGTDWEWECDDYVGGTSSKLQFYGFVWRQRIPKTSSSFTDIGRGWDAHVLRTSSGTFSKRIVGATGYKRSRSIAYSDGVVGVNSNDSVVSSSVYSYRDWRTDLFSAMKSVESSVPQYSSATEYHFGDIVYRGTGSNRRYYMCTATSMKGYQAPTPTGSSMWLNITPMFLDLSTLWKKTDDLVYSQSSGTRKYMSFSFGGESGLKKSVRIDAVGTTHTYENQDTGDSRNIGVYALAPGEEHLAEFLIEYFTDGGESQHFADWYYPTNNIADEDGLGQTVYVHASRKWVEDQAYVSEPQLVSKVSRYKDLHYDASLNVTWTNVVDNGHIYYVTVTNSDISVVQ